MLWIFVIQRMGKSLYNYIQSVQSLLAPAIAAVFLMGISWKKTSPKAGMWTLILGLVLGGTRLVTMIVNPEAHNVFTYIFFFIFFSIMVYHRVLNIAPCAMQ